MLGRCYVCSAPITPAQGPGLLWAEDGAPEERHAYHLDCWIHRQHGAVLHHEHAATTAELVAA